MTANLEDFLRVDTYESDQVQPLRVSERAWLVLQALDCDFDNDSQSTSHNTYLVTDVRSRILWGFLELLVVKNKTAATRLCTMITGSNMYFEPYVYCSEAAVLCIGHKERMLSRLILKGLKSVSLLTFGAHTLIQDLDNVLMYLSLIHYNENICSCVAGCLVKQDVTVLRNLLPGIEHPWVRQRVPEVIAEIEKLITSGAQK